MRVILKNIFIGAAVVAVGVGIYYAVQAKPSASIKQSNNQVQIVKIGTAEKKSVPINVVANGYVTAVNTVDVRPQIQNVVRSVHVTEGQDVKIGQLLFSLDQRNDLANVDKARAQLARDQADLSDADAILKRNQELLTKGFVSQALVDSALTKVQSLRAMIKSDQAAIESTTIMLSYNQIRATINGRIGIISVHAGSLAQPTGIPMLTIFQLDPIAVSFAVPERELSYIVSSYPKGDAPVIATLANKEEVSGTLSFIDNTADTQSGSIKMKAQFVNTDRKMWPGTFTSVRLVSRTLPDAVVVPAQSIVTGPTDKFVYVVESDNTVKIQKIAVIEIEGVQAVVSGLAAGSRIVVEGAQNLRPGTKVKTATKLADTAAAKPAVLGSLDSKK
jgi:RND family efflux transporter MFP subunit